jgi:hypothetical protein
MTEETPAHENLLYNLKNLHQAYMAVHDSAFKTTWKKMWPFSLFIAQVDYERAQRLLAKVLDELSNQQKALKNIKKTNESKSTKELTLIYQCLAQYTTHFSTSVTILRDVCAYRQSVIDQKPTLNIAQWNKLLKDYEKEISSMRKAGALVQESLLQYRIAGNV